jgi:inner membrane protein
MRRTLFVKATVTSLLALVLIVPLGAVRAVVQERHELSNSVLHDIKVSGVSEQRVLGPLVVVPYERTSPAEAIDAATGAKTVLMKTESGHLHFLPDALDVRAEVDTELRHRGIYSALMFNAKHEISGSFTIPEGFGVRPGPSTSYAWGEPYLVLGLTDTRGIRSAPALLWDDRLHDWASGTRGFPIHGIHGPLDPARTDGQRHSFLITLDLQGTQAIEYVPVGKETSVSMKARWPHPSFGGNFLPVSRTIDSTGFRATWKTSHLASNIEDTLAACLRDVCGSAVTALSVTFVDPVDVYLKSERAAKYGFLFVALTFVVFFLFEVLKKLAIHPVQYGLVGVALAMFFLLLLALAEHIEFALAYGVASAACIGLIAFYLSFVLGSVRRALGFTALLAALFGALYVLLASEDMALLLGAGLLFAILAAVMLVTRRVDWYRLSSDGPGTVVQGAS